MSEFVKAFRLGTVNLFGVMVPGFLLLFIISIGFFLPIFLLVLTTQVDKWAVDINWYQANKWFIVAIVLLFSYVAGFVLRLTSPHELDRLSVDYKKKDSDVWDYKYSDEAFPYTRLKRYFKERGHSDLADLVPWDPDPDKYKDNAEALEAERKKCSNTMINRMKLDIALGCPGLATTIDSQEAHIRLLSGAWLAIRATFPLVLFGTLVCSIVLLAPRLSADTGIKQLALMGKKYWWLQIIMNGFMLMAMSWGVHKIKQLFHRRRVNELLTIFHALLQCKRLADSSITAPQTCQTTGDQPRTEGKIE